MVGAQTLATEAATGALRPDIASGRRRLSLAWLGTLPFFAYALLFLFLPAGSVLLGAFKGAHGGWSFSTLHQLTGKTYIGAYKTSIEVSLVTAIAGGLLGFAIAYAAIREGTPRWIRSVLTTFSGVAANFGGIPLAFAFIATLGTIGVATTFLREQLGIDIYGNGFSLFSRTAAGFVSLSFKLPWMFLL